MPVYCVIVEAASPQSNGGASLSVSVSGSDAEPHPGAVGVDAGGERLDVLDELRWRVGVALGRLLNAAGGD